MTRRSILMVLIAAVMVAAALADGGCIGTIRDMMSPATPTPAPSTPTTMPTATPAPTAEATPVPQHVDLIYTAPLEAGKSNNSTIHVLTGTITYNGEPANGFEVLVDTVSGYEYGNKTTADGYFQVTFRDDWSPTYHMKITDASNIVIYSDKEPRPVNQTGPLKIKITVPSSKQISVTITPPVY